MATVRAQSIFNESRFEKGMDLFPSIRTSRVHQSFQEQQASPPLYKHLVSANFPPSIYQQIFDILWAENDICTSTCLGLTCIALWKMQVEYCDTTLKGLEGGMYKHVIPLSVRSFWRPTSADRYGTAIHCGDNALLVIGPSLGKLLEGDMGKYYGRRVVWDYWMEKYLLDGTGGGKQEGDWNHATWEGIVLARVPGSNLFVRKKKDCYWVRDWRRREGCTGVKEGREHVDCVRFDVVEGRYDVIEVQDTVDVWGCEGGDKCKCVVCIEMACMLEEKENTGEEENMEEENVEGEENTEEEENVEEEENTEEEDVEMLQAQLRSLIDREWRSRNSFESASYTTVMDQLIAELAEEAEALSVLRMANGE